MSMARLSILIVALAFLGWCPALLAAVEVNDQVLTSDRLNLRTCPSTASCPVIRILPRGIRLQVVGKQGDWLQVTGVSFKGTGWVHGDYLSLVGTKFSDTSSIPSASSGHLFITACILGALATMAIISTRQRWGIPSKQLPSVLAMSGILGLVIVLNQFGPLVAKLVVPWMDLEVVSFLWRVNDVCAGIKYWQVILYLSIAMMSVAALSCTVNDGLTSYCQGVGVGYMILPAATVFAMLIVALLYVLKFIYEILSYVFAFVVIPFIWISDNVLEPILKFLATPFIWLWQNFLRDIVLFIGTPFIWLWREIIVPLFAFLWTRLVKPIIFLFIGILASLICLFPIGIIGLMTADSVRRSVQGPLDSGGLFAQGAAMGFLLFEATLLALLGYFDLLDTPPPLSLGIPVALQVIVFLRLLLSNHDMVGTATSSSVRSKVMVYFQSSGLEAISTCLLVPIAVILSVAGREN